MIGLLKDLLSHQAWADAQFFWAWGASGALDDEDLRLRTDHLVLTQEYFLKVLKGDVVVAPPEHPVPGFLDLKRRCESIHQVFSALGRGLDDASLLRTVRVPALCFSCCSTSSGCVLIRLLAAGPARAS